MFAALALFLGGCAGFATQPEAEVLHEEEAEAAARIELEGYGRAAKFILCAEESCPKRTTKTLDVPRSPALTPDVVPLFDAKPATPAPVVKEVRFLPGYAYIDRNGRQTIKQWAPQAKGAARIIVRGFTDSTGGEKHNNRLALARAKAVRNLLVAEGVKAPIEIEAEGSCCFAADNNTPEGRAENRRVTVRILTAKE
jgi:outer membrane protein OmpA-like peptidoglycan-associated protein